MGKIFIIGGCNIDIQGAIQSKMRLRDSNPGEISYSYGGVARNVAENLARLGEEVFLVSVLGNDAFGEQLFRYCSEVGIHMEYVLRSEHIGTSTYLAVLDEEREMYTAVVDTSILSLLTKPYIKGVLDKISEEDVLIVDTNLEKELITYIVENSCCPLYIDPISTKKAEKIKDSLGSFHFIKPNRYEAELLSGLKVENEKEMLQYFLDEGVKEIVISMGEDGVIASDGEKFIRITHNKVIPVSPTGAGDSYMASFLWARRQGKKFAESLEIACAVAICTILDSKTVSQSISYDKIEKVREKMSIRGEEIC